MAKANDLIEAFVDESRKKGYEISGSVFKADFNGKSWTVGFWIRPTRTPGYRGREPFDDYYDLPGRCGKAKDPDFKKAIEKAIKKARRLEEGHNE